VKASDDTAVRAFADAMGLSYAEAVDVFAKAETDDVIDLVRKHGILIQVGPEEPTN
jgi:hypothetical protein